MNEIKTYEKELNQMQMQNNEFAQMCIQLFEEKSYEELELYLEQYRKKRKLLKKELDNQDLSIVYKSQFVQTFNIMYKLLEISNREHDLQINVIGITKNRKNAKPVILYLYKNPYARQRDIRNNINIARTTLSDLLKELVSARLVHKFENNENPFYELTVEMAQYVKNNFEDFNEVEIIDYDEIINYKKDVIEVKTEFLRDRSLNFSFESEKYLKEEFV